MSNKGEDYNIHMHVRGARLTTPQEWQDSGGKGTRIIRSINTIKVSVNDELKKQFFGNVPPANAEEYLKELLEDIKRCCMEKLREQICKNLKELLPSYLGEIVNSFKSACDAFKGIKPEVWDDPVRGHEMALAWWRATVKHFKEDTDDCYQELERKVMKELKLRYQGTSRRSAGKVATSLVIGFLKEVSGRRDLQVKVFAVSGAD